MSPAPYLLPPGAFDHFYRGGARIADLRGNEPGERRPEEWLGSTVTRWGETELGLSPYGDIYLRDAIEADPDGWLGGDYVKRFGANPGVLVKLLDPTERLPVHAHPTRRFARRHLDCPYGKSEAWVILEGAHSSGTVYVGTKRPVATAEWAELVEAQATDAMLELLVPIEVQVGDAVFVPSGTPHCTGADLFILELQEPTDFSLLLEWKGFAVDGRRDGHLDLGYDAALDLVRRDAFDDAMIDALTARARPPQVGVADSLMPAAAEPYFRAARLTARDDQACLVPAGFGVVLIVAGHGHLRWGDESSDRSSPTSVTVERGQVYIIPAAADCRLEGDLDALVAQGPAIDAPEPVEWDADQ